MELIYATGNLEKNYRLLRNQRRRETSNILVFKIDEKVDGINTTSITTSMLYRLQERIHLRIVYGKDKVYYLTCNAFDVFEYINKVLYGEKPYSIDEVKYAKILMLVITSKYGNKPNMEVADSLLTSREWLKTSVYSKREVQDIFHENVEDIKVNATPTLLRSNSIDEWDLISSNCDIYHRFKTREGLGSTFANKLINLSFRITVCSTAFISLRRYLMSSSLTILDIDELESSAINSPMSSSDIVYYTIDVVGSVENYVNLLKDTPRSMRFENSSLLEQLEEIISSYRIIY